MAIKKFMCVNCGKIVSPQTLICDACGTDYNEEKPKCEHFYTEWKWNQDPLHCSIILLLKCEKCKEVTLLNCSKDMLFAMLKNVFEL